MEKKIAENFLIQVDGRTEDVRSKEEALPGDTMQLLTKGNLVLRNGSYFITYAETEATGFPGCTTTVKVGRDSRRVSMIRYGKASAHLVIEKGVRHLCHYDTGYGAMTLGVMADAIDCQLTEEGGTASFSYTLDMDPMGMLSRNFVTIRVTPASADAPSASK